MGQSTTFTPDLDAILRCRPAFPGEVQDPDDAASAAAEWDLKFGDHPRPIRDARDLLIAVADLLVTLGLEPDVGGDEVTFQFLGHRCRIGLEDLEHRTVGISADEAAMLAAGLPVG